MKTGKKADWQLIVAIIVCILCGCLFFFLVYGMVNETAFATYFDGGNLQPTDDMLFGFGICLTAVSSLCFGASVGAVFDAIRIRSKCKKALKEEGEG